MSTTTPTLSRLSFAGVNRAKPAKTKTEYPVLRHPRAAELAARILALTEEAEALDATLTIDKAELRSLAVPEFFERHAGLHEVPSSMAAYAADGREVLVTLQNRYKQPLDEAPLLALLGAHAERFLKPTFELKIDGEKIPQPMQQAAVDAIANALAMLGCGDALTVKESINPSADFHAARHSIFDPATNMAIENLMPMTAAVKTKGRK
jgi:hypothetical protein